VPHVREADVAVEIGSYLDIDAVVAAALASGAQAIHPGYGFLSERAEFARAVEKAGLTLIGPSAEVMEAMGRKDAAREVAVAAGVPVVPRGEDAGFPVLVKAAAGGGGKGMRIVRSEGELAEAMAAARREALSAFGDETLLVEKYVERGRHIEVQVFGDAHGNVVHLHERDCSTQRRHQKVLEEAPAPTLTDAQRELVTSSAVALARQVGYTNAGTVEFLLDEVTGEPYFLEMNTRLQVEHPVTEAITGLDLVELQLCVAAGEAIPFAQGDVSASGHAIEARVYAEDAFGGFLPQAGTATVVSWPARTMGTQEARVPIAAQSAHTMGTRSEHVPIVRVDHALESGQTVTTGFDPMLGKVIVHAATREGARRALVRALDDTAILGLTTNTGFLRELAASAEFRDAEIDTAWLDRNEVPAPDPAEARRAAAWEWRLAHAATGPFADDGFRVAGPAAAYTVELDEPVTLTGTSPRQRPVARVSRHGVELAHHGQRYLFAPPDPAADHAAVADGTLTAPMPGTVLDVRVEPGAKVEEGQVLAVLEAMKMELALKAPFAGTVTEVAARTGAQVALGATLLVVEPETSEEAEA